MKILIADDHLVVRKGLMQIITDEFPEAIFDEVNDGKEAHHKIKESKYDLAILDITMPEMSGLEVLRLSKEEGIKIPILVLTTHPEEQYAIRVLKTGAAGFLSKDAASDELINAIRKIMAGKRYISDSIAELLAEDLNSVSNKPQHELLSDREFEVFKLIANGMTVSEIADKLCLSVPTISTFRRRILEKMKLKNNAEMMHYAMLQKLVE